MLVLGHDQIFITVKQLLICCISSHELWLPWESRIVVTVVVTNCGYRGNHELWLPRESRIVVTVVVTNCGYRGNHELWLPW
jgi:hypothetical protein